MVYVTLYCHVHVLHTSILYCTYGWLRASAGAIRIQAHDIWPESQTPLGMGMRVCSQRNVQVRVLLSNSTYVMFVSMYDIRTYVQSNHGWYNYYIIIAIVER